MVNEEEYYWTQERVTHCPKRDCKGMLLTHPMYHYMKCSDCKKKWVEEIRYVEYHK